MKKLIAMLVLLPFLSFAQTFSTSSLFDRQMLYYNPAYTGMNYQLRGGIQYGNNFRRIGVNQQNLYASYEQNFDSLRSGIGMVYARESYGFSSIESVQFNYRYAHKFSSSFSLHGGISAGLSKFDVDITDFTGFNSIQKSEMKPMIHVGIGASWRNLTIGYSALQVNRPYYNEYSFQSSDHHTLYANYDLMLTRKFQLNTFLFAMTDGFQSTIQPLVRLTYEKVYFIQLGIKNDSGIQTGIGASIHKRIHLGYAYEVSRSKLSNAHVWHRHEFFLHYGIQRLKQPPMKTVGTPAF